MACWLKQSTAVDIGMGPFLDSTDGNTAETGLTITQPDIRLKKNGGAWAQKNAAQTLTHEEAGWYEVALNATDTDTLGILIVAIHESGALPVWREFNVVPANVWDSFFSTDLLQVDAQQWLGGTIATPTVTGVPEVDITHFNGTAGTFASGRPEVNTSHIAGSAVSTTTAQIGTNIVQISGSGTSADNLEVGGLGLVVSTCATGSTTTQVETNLTEATNDHYNGRVITFTSGALLGQTASITDYNGTSKALTVSTLTEAPANTDQFVIS